MKNTIKMLGLIALVTVVGFSFAACDDDDGNPFVGTWTGEGNWITLVIASNSTWTATIEGDSTYTGTYTYSGNSATFTESRGATFGSATVSGNTMSINQEGTTYQLTKR